MTKRPNDPPKASTRSQRRPTFIVEMSLAEVVVPKIDTWLDDLAAAIPRVISQTDGEAVHDLRVAMRRIRSLLRVVRPVFGSYYVNLIRKEFKQVAGATGTLRDEEVLEETIRALPLSDAHRKAIEPWLARRGEREKSLRATVVQLLESGALEAPRTHLRALIRLPVRPGHDKEAHKFARKIVFAAHAQVEALRTADVDDVVGMHDLRIAHKRLRYAVEALGPALPPELRAWGQVATKFQKVLGNLHDQDVAMETVRAAKTLSDDSRAAVLEALAKTREQYAQRYLDMVGFELETPAEPETELANEAPAEPKLGQKGKKKRPKPASTKDATARPVRPSNPSKASKPSPAKPPARGRASTRKPSPKKATKSTAATRKRSSKAPPK